MDKDQVKKAIEYATATNKIEDLTLSDSELDEIIDAVKNDNKDFIEEIVKENGDEQNDEIKRGPKL